MALRRLMSGWLIALAAMARATAAALERAAAERSAPAVDPILAELAERYPDAPAHWLTFVAERMSRAADAVEMSSAPAESEAERLSAPEPLMAVAPGSMFADGPPPGPAPITPGFRPARRREEAATPSLAELASRSSEVWRRPSGSPNRPSRPVFARPAEAATPTAAATARNDAPTTVRGSRSPLRVDPGAASRIRPDRSPVDSVAFDVRPSDLGQPLAATPPDRALSAEPATAASMSMTPAKRPARNAGSNDLLPMTGEAVREPPGTRRVQAASKTGSETALRGPLFDPTPPSPSRSRPPTREPAARAARPPPRDSSISEAEAPPSRRGQPRPFAAVRSAARRMIVRTMAALGPRVASASHHLAPAGKPPSVTPPTIIRSPRRSTSASAPTSATTGENGAAPA
jgi:hypothetical protein